MRRQDRVRRGQKRVVRPHRLDAGHIGGVSRQLSRAQRVAHRLLVHKQTAGRVHDACARPAQGEALAAHNAARLLRQRTVQGDHVTAAEQLVQPDEFHAAAEPFVAHRARVADHAHAERLCDGCRGAADRAVSQHAERLAVQLVRGEDPGVRGDVRLPVAVSHGGVEPAR